MKFFEKLRLKFIYKFLPHFKKNWFPYIIALVMYTSFSLFSSLGESVSAKKCQVKSDRPNCYIFYGIAQNDINKNRNLRINYLIEGFPMFAHTVFINIKDTNGHEDFLYSQTHSRVHKAHYDVNGGQRTYKTSYKIPAKLKPGTYWLQVHFDFKVGILGALKPKRLSSNWMKFHVRM